LTPHDCLYILRETKKVTREAAAASSRLPFPPHGERKGHRELSQTPLPETPEAPRKGQPGPPQTFLAMDFIPRGPFSSLSLTVRSLPCIIQEYVCISGPFSSLSLTVPKRPSQALPNPSPGNSRGSQKRSTQPSPELPRDELYPTRSVLCPFPHGPFSSLSYTSVDAHLRWDKHHQGPLAFVPARGLLG